MAKTVSRNAVKKSTARSEGDIFEQSERTEEFAEVVKIIEHEYKPSKNESLLVNCRYSTLFFKKIKLRKSYISLIRMI